MLNEIQTASYLTIFGTDRVKGASDEFALKWRSIN